ncbi:hypothetical protein T07_12498 [Trichinella nelsoni]|uniref:Uncharacterized protein n=1 Tax=Trichinella nelsoni TaxID=6336 RepID=A0A0V0RGJ8_9BILA|nr:hypothetical protein T07_12498 [Trichinella nelsoni]
MPYMSIDSSMSERCCVRGCEHAGEKRRLLSFNLIRWRSRNSGELPEVEPRSCTTSRCDSTPPQTDVALDDPSGGLRNTPRPSNEIPVPVQSQSGSCGKTGVQWTTSDKKRAPDVLSPQSMNQRNHGRIGGRMMVEGGFDGLRVCVVKSVTGRQITTAFPGDCHSFNLIKLKSNNYSPLPECQIKLRSLQ